MILNCTWHIQSSSQGLTMFITPEPDFFSKSSAFTMEEWFWFWTEDKSVPRNVKNLRPKRRTSRLRSNFCNFKRGNPTCHIPFMQAFSLLKCILEVIPLIYRNNFQITIQCRKRMRKWDVATRLKLSDKCRLQVVSLLLLFIYCCKTNDYIIHAKSLAQAGK